MVIEWKQTHVGPNWIAWRGKLLTGEVIQYQDGIDGPRYYAGFADQERVSGRFATVDEAKAAVEGALASQPPASPPSGHVRSRPPRSR